MPVKVVQRFERMIQTSATKAEPRQGQPSPPPPADAETIKWLYDVLTILDSKAGALLAFDGLLLAAEALMHEKMLEKAGLVASVFLGIDTLHACNCSAVPVCGSSVV